jgi:hypothetical protein
MDEKIGCAGLQRNFAELIPVGAIRARLETPDSG